MAFVTWLTPHGHLSSPAWLFDSSASTKARIVMSRSGFGPTNRVCKHMGIVVLSWFVLLSSKQSCGFKSPCVSCMWDPDCGLIHDCVAMPIFKGEKQIAEMRRRERCLRFRSCHATSYSAIETKSLGERPVETGWLESMTGPCHHQISFIRRDENHGWIDLVGLACPKLQILLLGG